MRKAKMNYEFTEGIGGGKQPSYLLLLNGGICKGYPKTNFTKEQAEERADNEVESIKNLIGEKKVAYTKLPIK